MSNVSTSLPRIFPGTGNIFAKMVFAHNRKNYSPAMKITLELFNGRNSDGKVECSNLADASKKILTYLKQKANIDYDVRRLAQWFILYFESEGIVPPDINTITNDIRSTPEEIEARKGNV